IVSLFYIYVFFGYLVTFFFFTVPLLWLFTSIIFDIFCKGYGVIFSPACVFFVFIPSFGLLVPYFRKFMKLHKFVITGYYRMDYAQRKFISEINSYYYRTAFRINESRNYEKWALGREVSSLRNMVEDTHVAYHKPDPYVVTVKKDFS